MSRARSDGSMTRSAPLRRVLEERPRDSIVFFAVGQRERRNPGAGTQGRTAGQRVIHNLILDAAAVGQLTPIDHPFNILPSPLAAPTSAIWSNDGELTDGLFELSRQAYALQALAKRKHNSAVNVVPSLALVLLHHRK